MKPFEHYIDTKDVRKSSPDKALAQSLIKDMHTRIELVSKLDVKNFSKIIFENVYDALRDFCDALLALDGFKAYSHEAAITYLKKYKFNDCEIAALDRFRYIRNGSKYYGKEISKDDALEILDFFSQNKSRFNAIANEKIK